MKRTLYYRLEGHEPVPATVQEADALLGDAEARTVGRADVGGAVISTVFLTIDHAFGDGPPMLFETRVFAEGNEELHGLQRRCSTWGQAEAQHRAMVAYVTAMAEGRAIN